MVLQFINGLSSAFACGALWQVWRQINPATRDYSAQQYALFHQDVLVRHDRWVMACSLISVASAVGLLIHHHIWQTLPTKLTTEGLFCAVLSLILLFMKASSNLRFKEWPTDDPPAEWIETRQRWQRLHGIQTWLGLLAFCFFLLAGLVASTPIQN